MTLENNIEGGKELTSNDIKNILNRIDNPSELELREFSESEKAIKENPGILFLITRGLQNSIIGENTSIDSEIMKKIDNNQFNQHLIISILNIVRKKSNIEKNTNYKIRSKEEKLDPLFIKESTKNIIKILKEINEDITDEKGEIDINNKIIVKTIINKNLENFLNSDFLSLCTYNGDNNKIDKYLKNKKLIQFVLISLLEIYLEENTHIIEILKILSDEKESLDPTIQSIKEEINKLIIKVPEYKKIENYDIDNTNINDNNKYLEENIQNNIENQNQDLIKNNENENLEISEKQNSKIKNNSDLEENLDENNKIDLNEIIQNQTFENNNDIELKENFEDNIKKIIKGYNQLIEYYNLNQDDYIKEKNPFEKVIELIINKNNKEKIDLNNKLEIIYSVLGIKEENKKINNISFSVKTLKNKYNTELNAKETISKARDDLIRQNTELYKKIDENKKYIDYKTGLYDELVKNHSLLINRYKENKDINNYNELKKEKDKVQFELDNIKRELNSLKLTEEQLKNTIHQNYNLKTELEKQTYKIEDLEEENKNKAYEIEELEEDNKNKTDEIEELKRQLDFYKNGKGIKPSSSDIINQYKQNAG